jgi:hypothetical protein
MPFWKMLKEGNDHFEVAHMEPKVDVCDRHYVFDAQQPANSTKPIVFNSSGHCPAYEVADEIAGPALEKQRNDEYQIAQLTRLNTPVAPIVMGTDGGMNRVFVAKLEETQPVYDNDGHIHAPPIHPGMPKPTISGPREDPEAGTMKTASVQKPSLFGGLFDRTTTQTTTQVASANSSSNSEGFFARLFKPKSETAPQPAAQGTALAALKPTPAPRKVETAKLETKSEPQKTETRKPETPAAAAPRPATQAPQVASAAPTAGLIKGAQPLVPAGSFDSRWAGLQ